MPPLSTRALALAALLSGAGCVLTHRCAVPDPVVEASPGAPVPLPVRVELLPGPAAAEASVRNTPQHLWLLDGAPPTLALFERLAPTAFHGPGPPGTLQIRITRLDVAFAHPIVGPYRAAVAYQVALRDAEGRELGTWTATADVEQPMVWELSSHCTGLGRAVARAMQGAAADLLARLSADPALAAWAEAAGSEAPRLAARPAAAYPAPGEGGAPGPTPAAPVPVEAGLAMPPRTFTLRTGIGVFSPDEAPGALEQGSAGPAFALIGGEYRPLAWLGVEFEASALGRSFSGATLPPLGLLAVPRRIFLSSSLIGLGLRAIAAGGPVEPWVGATGQLVRTDLSGSYSLLGVTGSGWSSRSWSVGLDLGAGLSFHLGGRWLLGLEARRLLGRARFEPFPASVSIGGWGATALLGATLP